MDKELPLITPHGDRERKRGSDNTVVVEAHYPSWGSGTGVIFECGEA